MATFRGIPVRFVADVTSVMKAIRQVEARAKELDATLREVNKGLKLDPTNADLMKQKVDMLNRNFELMSAKLKELNKMKEQMSQVNVNELSVPDKALYNEQLQSLNNEILKTENKIRNISYELKEFAVSIPERFVAGAEGIRKSIWEIDEQAQKLEVTLSEVSTALKFEPTNTTLIAKKVDMLNKSIELTTAKLAKLNLMKEQMEKVDTANLSAPDKLLYTEQLQSLNAEILKTENKLRSFKAEVRETVQVLNSQLIAGFNNLKTAVSQAARVIGIAEGALIALCAASVKTGKEFDTAMSQVAATLNISQGSYEFSELRNTAQEMGRTTVYTASQAAEALNYLALGGLNAAESMEALPKVLTLAKAGTMELGDAANVVVAEMKALDLSSEEMDKLLDQMARTAQKSKTTVAEMGDTILKTGAAFNLAGQSTETMSAIIGTLANRYKDISARGETLRTALTRIMTQSSKLEELGVQVTDSSGKVRDFIDIFNDLRISISDLGSEEQATILTKIFGARGYTYVKYLMDSTTGEIQQLRAEIENSSGAAEAMASTMTDNLGGDLYILKSAVESLQIAISDELNPTMRETAQEGTQIVNELENQVKRGELKAVLKEFGEALSQFILNGANSLIEVLPTILKFLEMIMEHANLIIGTLIGFKIGQWTSNIVNGLLTIITTVVRLGAVIKTAATSAALMKAMLDPTGITAIATGLGLIAGAVAGIATSSALATEETKKYSKDVQELIDSTEELKTAAEDSYDAFRKSRQETASTYDSYKLLADKLYSIADGHKANNGEMQVATELVAMLNSSIPNLNLEYDKVNNTLSIQKQKLEEIIEARKNEAFQSAYSERMKETAKEIVDAETNQTNLEYEKSQLEEELKPLYEERDRIKNEIEDNYKKYSYNIAELKNGTKGNDRFVSTGLYYDLDKVQEKINEIEDPLSEINKRIDDSISIQEKGKKQLDDYSESMADYSEASRNVVIGQADLTEAEKEAAYQILELYDAEEDHSGEISKLLNQYPKVEQALSDAGYSIEEMRGETEGLTESQDELNSKLEEAKQAVSEVRQELNEYLSVLKDVNDGTTYTTAQILEMLEKYPELSDAVKKTSEGYSIEKDAVKELTKAKAEQLQLEADNAVDAAREDFYNTVNSNVSGAEKSAAGEALRNAEDYRYRVNQITSSIIGGEIYYGEQKSSSSGTDDTKSAIEILDHRYNMGLISAKDYYDSLENINEKYYKGKKKYLSEYNSLEEKIYNGRKQLAEEEKNRRESEAQEREEAYRKAAEDEIADVEHRYKMGELSEKEYYQKLEEINKKYYKGKSQYISEYNDLAEKVYSGLKKAQEDDISNAKELEERIKSVTEAQQKLKNANTQEVQVFSSAAGFHSEKNTEAITEAENDLKGAQYDLAETLMKLGKIDGNDISSQLGKLSISNIKNMLPDLSALYIPTTGSSTAAAGTNSRKYDINVSYRSGDIILQGEVDKTTLSKLRSLFDTLFKEFFEKYLNEYLSKANLDRMIGG